MATFVLVHGSWAGGWVWQTIAKDLRAAGHEAYTPTLTGQGERVHLGSPTVGLDTHIQHVVNVLRYEKLSNVTLVGISYGGEVITGVAEQVPELLNQLIYLDVFVPEDGQPGIDMLGPEIMAGFEPIIKSLGAEGWRLPWGQGGDERWTYALMRSVQQPLAINDPQASRLKHTYVLFTGRSAQDPMDQMLKGVFERTAAKVRQEGWNYREWPFGHISVLEHPHEAAALLLELV
jgi:pimeloyl-ACP methyl ester carboxylesterase